MNIKRRLERLEEQHKPVEYRIIKLYGVKSKKLLWEVKARA